MTKEERAFAFLLSDLEAYCAECMKVKPTEGPNVPFIWNRVQRYVHVQACFEAQRLS